MTNEITPVLNSPKSATAVLARPAEIELRGEVSLEGMQEIYSHRDDEDHSLMQARVAFPRSPTIELVDLSFRYPGAGRPEVLRGVNLTIPVGKVTAIVGASGSGKTTILKLLLSLYRPAGGEISLGDVPLAALDDQAWRSRCGVVMQDGYIFSGSVARNIALGSEPIDPQRLKRPSSSPASRIISPCNRTASTHPWAPKGRDSPVDKNNASYSPAHSIACQISYSLTKPPARSMRGRKTPCLTGCVSLPKGRTVVVIAHRLSTVREADQIVVLEQGRIVELGTHADLVAQSGTYFAWCATSSSLRVAPHSALEGSIRRQQCLVTSH